MILLIYGAGGLGSEIYELALRNNKDKSRWEQIYCIDDFAEEGKFNGIDRIHFTSWTQIANKNELECVVAVGEPKQREFLYEKIRKSGIRIATLIDDTAIVSSTAVIGEGVVVREYTMIGPHSQVDENVLMQPYSCIGHDIQIGMHSVLSAFCVVGGQSIIEEQVYIGMHAAIKEKICLKKMLLSLWAQLCLEMWRKIVQ